MDASHILRPENAALDKICEEIFELPKQPDEFTANEVAERLQIDPKTAMNRLKRMVEDGKLTSRAGKDENNHASKLFKYASD